MTIPSSASTITMADSITKESISSSPFPIDVSAPTLNIPAFNGYGRKDVYQTFPLVLNPGVFTSLSHYLSLLREREVQFKSLRRCISQRYIVPIVEANIHTIAIRELGRLIKNIKNELASCKGFEENEPELTREEAVRLLHDALFPVFQPALISRKLRRRQRAILTIENFFPGIAGEHHCPLWKHVINACIAREKNMRLLPGSLPLSIDHFLALPDRQWDLWNDVYDARSRRIVQSLQLCPYDWNYPTNFSWKERANCVQNIYPKSAKEPALLMSVNTRLTREQAIRQPGKVY